MSSVVFPTLPLFPAERQNRACAELSAWRDDRTALLSATVGAEGLVKPTAARGSADTAPLRSELMYHSFAPRDKGTQAVLNLKAP